MKAARIYVKVLKKLKALGMVADLVKGFPCEAWRKGFKKEVSINKLRLTLFRKQHSALA